MTLQYRHVNPLGTRVYMGTITDRALIHDVLRQFALETHTQTATFELLGGLHEVEFTAYDFDTQTRQTPLVFSRAMEIVSAHGTISRLEDALHVHTHMTIAYRDAQSPTGIVVVAGHVARAVAFAVEFTLTAYDGAPMVRGLHPATGLQLWHFDD